MKVTVFIIQYSTEKYNLKFGGADCRKICQGELFGEMKKQENVPENCRINREINREIRRNAEKSGMEVNSGMEYDTIKNIQMMPKYCLNDIPLIPVGLSVFERKSVIFGKTAGMQNMDKDT